MKESFKIPEALLFLLDVDIILPDFSHNVVKILNNFLGGCEELIEIDMNTYNELQELLKAMGVNADPSLILKQGDKIKQKVKNNSSSKKLAIVQVCMKSEEKIGKKIKQEVNIKLERLENMVEDDDEVLELCDTPTTTPPSLNPLYLPSSTPSSPPTHSPTPSSDRSPSPPRKVQFRTDLGVDRCNNEAPPSAKNVLGAKGVGLRAGKGLAVGEPRAGDGVSRGAVVEPRGSKGGVSGLADGKPRSGDGASRGMSSAGGTTPQEKLQTTSKTVKKGPEVVNPGTSFSSHGDHKSDKQKRSSRSRWNCLCCGETGHFSRECPRGPVTHMGRVGMTCQKCGIDGHLDYECWGCYICGQPSHYARDCPQVGGRLGGLCCYNCGGRGHFARECPNGAGRN